MKKNDFIFILSVLLVLAVSFPIIKNSAKDGNTVRITVDGKVFTEKPLSENCEIHINGTNTAVIENGAVYMKDASCPDKLCMHQGKAYDSSKKIICLPNKVVIEVIKKSEIDTVVK
ncbi:MAG: NusG domain II-containing protein [Clostridia bacterium]|nr:NusG domain II-containing protein [Clostridia bacterium]MBQ7751755.1 NusG domain II-containing protein [Clostridia bacterium]